MKQVLLDELMIWSENPRHSLETAEIETFSEKDVIKILFEVVGHEKMLRLMSDIAENGLSPATIPVVVEGDDFYNVYDGNRRISALKILRNPKLLDDDALARKIEKLSSGSTPIPQSVFVYVTDEVEALNLLDKTHLGEQGGIGVIAWEAFQRDTALEKRGIHPKYPFAFKVAKAMGFSRKSHFKIKYTDLDRIFGFKALRSFFRIEDFDDSDRLGVVITQLKGFRKSKGIQSFSRLLNSAADAEEFCNWTLQKRDDCEKSVVSVFPESIIQYQAFSVDEILLKARYSDESIGLLSRDEVQFGEIISPDGEIVQVVDTAQVGKWIIRFTQRKSSFSLELEISPLKRPTILFHQPALTIRENNSLDLRECVLHATNGFGEDVKQSLSIESLDSGIIEGHIFSHENSVANYRVQFSFIDVSGQRFAQTADISVISDRKPATGKSHQGANHFLSIPKAAGRVDISPATNQLIKEMNHFSDWREGKCLITAASRALFELIYHHLKREGLIASSDGSLEQKIKAVKGLVLDNANSLSLHFPSVFPSRDAERSKCGLIDEKRLSDALNLAAHHSADFLDEKTIENYRSCLLEPVILWATYLLRIKYTNS
ncbi:MAG: hypothetical protein FWD93_01080 [Coriobacteriia bacterium]|nr:hypothetical protein [Coriobacteriia bacterium]